MEREEEQIEKAVARLNGKLLGMVLGVLFAVGLFLATNFLVIKGGTDVGAHLKLLGQYFPGYRVTFLGSLLGAAYAFVVGFIIGNILGTVYNRIVEL